MKKLFIFILLLTLSTPCWGRDLNDPSILKFYARLNSNTSDYSGNEVTDGTFTGEAYTSTFWGGTAANFDGSNDKIAYGSVSSGIKSVSFWCNPNTTTEQFMELASGVDIDVASGTIGTTGWTSPTVYVNGKISSTLVANIWQFVTVISSTAINANATNLGVETTNFGDTDLAEVKFYNIVLTQDEIQTLYELNFPDYDPLQQPIDVLPDVSDSSLKGAWLNKAVVGAKDLSSNNNNGTITSVPIWLEVGVQTDGTDDKIDFGDIGNVRTISMLINPTTTTQEILLCDTAKDIMVSSGTVTYTGITSTATYVNGSSSTSLAANEWSHLVLQIPTTDCNNFELANDGSNYGAIKVKDLRAYSDLKIADWIKNEYLKNVPDDSLVLSVQNGDKDLSRYDTTVILYNGTVVGDGMEFDGSDDYITVNADLDFEGETEDFTTIAWVTVDIENTSMIAGIWESNDDGWRFIMPSSSGGILCSIDAIDFSSTSTDLNNAGWHQVACVFDRDGNGQVYIDGVADGTPVALNSEAMEITQSSLMISRQNPASSIWYWNGNIKDLRIYNTAKSADWIKQDYERTKKFY